MRYNYLTHAGTGGDRPLLLSAALRNKTCGCRLGTVEKKCDFEYWGISDCVLNTVFEIR